MGLVCHCFGYSENDIRNDLAENGRSTILEKIIAEKNSGRCQCVEKSPQRR